jgi:hypothetical protein
MQMIFADQQVTIRNRYIYPCGIERHSLSGCNDRQSGIPAEKFD